MNLRSNKTARRLQRFSAYVVLSILSLAFALPFFWMVSSSLKHTEQIFVFPPQWIPRPVVWQNYRDAVSFIPFLRNFLNTMIVCIGTVVGNLFSASLVAYSFSILRWRWRNSLFALVLATMLLPPQVTMIPVFIIFRKLHMIDTFFPLIIPAFFGSPFFIFLLRQFFIGIPHELPESARIDGCNEFQIYYRIILPLSVPALAAVVLFSFLWSWTDFLYPLIYLHTQSKFTLSLAIQQFQSTHTVEWGMLMAASTLLTLPVITLFFFAQKTFVQGIITTGLKG
ncbi:carbohydrate ABC transporter permease [Candidatus Sumerlaeota bacterium]|nr:carbohydrate ABC transporter permease [Candidatus Sumerlaeota bacterium]